jgi:hypothetical protein
VQPGRRERHRLIALEQRAALLEQLAGDQRLDVGQRAARHRVELVGAPPHRRARPQDPVPVRERHEHLREAERVADPRADGREDLLARLPRAHLRGDAQQVLDGRAVPARLRRGVGVLERGGGVVADGRDEREPVVVGTAPVGGLVDRDDAEHVAGGVDERDEEQVLGVPGAGVVGRRERGGGERREARPVHGARRDEVRAVVAEALLHELAVLRPARGLADQLARDRLVALEQHHLEVVPGGTVAVDEDALEARGAAHGLGHGGEDGVGIAAAGAQRASDGQDALEGIMGRRHQS